MGLDKGRIILIFHYQALKIVKGAVMRQLLTLKEYEKYKSLECPFVSNISLCIQSSVVSFLQILFSQIFQCSLWDSKEQYKWYFKPSFECIFMCIFNESVMLVSISGERWQPTLLLEECILLYKFAEDSKQTHQVETL